MRRCVRGLGGGIGVVKGGFIFVLFHGVDLFRGCVNTNANIRLKRFFDVINI